MMPYDDDPNGFEPLLEENVVREFFQVVAPHPGGVKVVALGMTSDRFECPVNLNPESTFDVVRCATVFSSNFPNVLGRPRMDNQFHQGIRLPSASLLELFDAQSLDFTGI